MALYQVTLSHKFCQMFYQEPSPTINLQWDLVLFRCFLPIFDTAPKYNLLTIKYDKKKLRIDAIGNLGWKQPRQPRDCTKSFHSASGLRLINPIWLNLFCGLRLYRGSLKGFEFPPSTPNGKPPQHTYTLHCFHASLGTGERVVGLVRFIGVPPTLQVFHTTSDKWQFNRDRWNIDFPTFYMCKENRMANNLPI